MLPCSLMLPVPHADSCASGYSSLFMDDTCLFLWNVSVSNVLTSILNDPRKTQQLLLCNQC